MGTAPREACMEGPNGGSIALQLALDFLDIVHSQALLEPALFGGYNHIVSSASSEGWPRELMLLWVIQHLNLGLFKADGSFDTEKNI